MTEKMFPSFAKTLATLQKLAKIESGLAGLISSSKVPPVETRKFLKSESPVQASNTPLFQFFNTMLKDIGLGNLELVEVEQFKHVYVVRDNPVAHLYSEIKGKKTCYVTADALSQIYAKDLGIVNTAEEIECVNAGGEKCTFEVNLQPISVFQIVFDAVDREIIQKIRATEKTDVEKIAEELDLENEEVEYRLEVLRRYHILGEDNRLTRVGLTYSKYPATPLIASREDFPPPWETLSEISSKIAGASSFAEAMSESVDSTPIVEVDEEEIINLAEEARKSKSFAELITKYLKKEKGGE